MRTDCLTRACLSGKGQDEALGSLALFLGLGGHFHQASFPQLVPQGQPVLWAKAPSVWRGDGSVQQECTSGFSTFLSKSPPSPKSDLASFKLGRR